MKVNRWIAIPVAGLAALVIGVAAVAAAPSPSPSASGSTNYAQVFVDKLAAILHLNRTQTQAALKQAQLQTVDQMLKDGKITQSQADAMKARINAGSGLGAVRPFARGFGGLGAAGTVLRDVTAAELSAAAGALHMSPSDLQAQLKAGKSLADLEQAKGVTDATVKAAMKTAATGVLDKAVKAGTITQAQENTILSRADRGFGFRGRKAAPQPTPAGFFTPA